MITCQDLHCPSCKHILSLMNDTYYCPICDHFYPIIEGIPSFVDQNMTVESFDSSIFQFLFEMEKKHFWHVERKAMILEFLRGHVPDLARSRMLEIGCGNGVVLTYLKQNGVNIEGCDVFIDGLKFCRQRAKSVTLYQADILALPFCSAFDIVGVFDVLEHIKDDNRALIEVNRVLKLKGKLVLTVPACKFLWSYYDVFAKHQRRYDRKELINKLEQNGFIIKKISFYMFFLFPVLALKRLITDKTCRDRKHDLSEYLEVKTVPLINEVFMLVLKLERWLMRFTSLPFGSSLIVLAEKHEEI